LHFVPSRLINHTMWCIRSIWSRGKRCNFLSWYVYKPESVYVGVHHKMSAIMTYM